MAGIHRSPVAGLPGSGEPVAAGELAAGNRDPETETGRHVRRVDKPGRLGLLVLTVSATCWLAKCAHAAHTSDTFSKVVFYCVLLTD